MSELTARLAIYGSIDRAVVEGRTPAEEVASHLLPYREQVGAVSAAGWYDAVNELVPGPDGPSSAPLPPADPAAAVAELADHPLSNPIEAEQRLRTLFLADRLLSAADRASEGAVASALRAVVEFGRDRSGTVADSAAAARQLTAMLGDRDRFTGRGGYAEMVAAARSAGLVSEMTAALAAVACEEGTAWYQVPGSSDVDIAAVITSRVVLTVDERSVDELRMLFHPGRWPHCLPTFWGAMDPLPAPPPDAPSPPPDPGSSLFMYREHVGDQTNHSEWFSPVLEFWYDELETGPPGHREVDGFALHYGMARTLPAGEVQDPRILVDDGELTVRRSNVTNGSMTVTATTYKKLAMRPPLPSAGLAALACASGWAAQAKALVSGCLLNP